MQAYTVYEPPEHAADRIDRAEALVFVKDGFSWGAALFAPLWLLLGRLWWPFLGYVAIAVALQVIGSLLAVDQRWVSLIGLAFNLLLGFEANSLRRWGLERRGWSMVGAATGRNLAEAERRFLDNWLTAQPIIASAQAGQGQRLSGATRSTWGGIAQLFGAKS